jgi:hypothetical protein
MFVVDVESGGSLWHGIAQRLGELGSAFAAVRAFELAKSNGADAAEIGSIEPLPYSKWSSKERRLAPPLVVTVDGADCRANALADFLDGGFKILLLLKGEATPAPLIRLVTPGTYVAQALDIAGLKGISKWDGPGSAQWFPKPQRVLFMIQRQPWTRWIASRSTTCLKASVGNRWVV